MEKFFNTAGLCKPDLHYMIDPLPRLTGVRALIDRQNYFILHAPRQTGKTTYLYALMNELNQEGKYTTLQVNIQSARVAPTIEEGLRVICEDIKRQAEIFLPGEEQPPKEISGGVDALKNFLTQWAKQNPKPLVLFVDEVDSLRDELFLSLLYQLRSGFEARPKHFPHSIALVGLRDVRDYKISMRPEEKKLGTGSPFNIKSESLIMGDFSLEEVQSLLSQYGEKTGQHFSEEVQNKIYDFTCGQPWLTNSLARQIVEKILDGDVSQKITLDHVILAKEQIIQRRDTHLDSLIDKLKEPEVKKIVEAIIAGKRLVGDSLDDDLSYVADLGLTTRKGQTRFANPIYAEIIPRVINIGWQSSFSDEVNIQWYLKPDKTLDMEKLLKAFQKFYRRHSESWLDEFSYQEAGKQLLLMAYLQRVVNSGGRIEREMAVGNERLDLTVFYREQWFVMELKLYHDSYTLEEAKEQLTRYLNKMGLQHGYLLLFETRKKKTWEEKIYWKTLEYEGKTIELVGL